MLLARRQRDQMSTITANLADDVSEAFHKGLKRAIGHIDFNLVTIVEAKLRYIC